MFCTKCGKQLKEGAAFCVYCGSTVKNEINSTENTQPTETITPTEDAPSTENSSLTEDIQNPEVLQSPEAFPVAEETIQDSGYDAEKKGKVPLFLKILILVLVLIIVGVVLFFFLKSRKVNEGDSNYTDAQEIGEEINTDGNIEGNVDETLNSVAISSGKQEAEEQENNEVTTNNTEDITDGPKKPGTVVMDASSGDLTDNGSLTKSQGNSESIDEVAQESNTKDSNEYMLPGSDSKYISMSDLKGFTAEECRIARNEIYARHGRKFNDEELQAYFNAKGWYKGTIDADDFSENMLNEFEQSNREVIVEFEKKSGYR